jgi:hypothetical protein
MISTMDKEQHSSHRNSYIESVMKDLPKELDISSDDALAQFIADIEKLPKSILRHKGFYDKLYSRSNGELQRYVEMVMQSAPMDVVLVDLKKLTDIHEEDMFSPTPIGGRQILSPSYLPVWVVFRDLFLRDEDANWLEALCLFHKNDKFLQKNRSVHEYYDQDFLKRLRKWNRSPLPPRSDADNAADFVAGLNDDIQAVLSVKYSDSVDPRLLHEWQLSRIVRAAIAIESTPTFKKEKLLRVQVKEMHSMFDEHTAERGVVAEEKVVGAVQGTDIFGVYSTLNSAQKKAYDSAADAIRTKGEPPKPNRRGQFDYFRLNEKPTTTMPVCLKFPTAREDVRDCQHVGHFVQKCPLNAAISRQGTQRVPSPNSVAPVPATQHNSASTVAAVQVDHSEDQWNRQDKVNSALLEMAEFVVSKTTDSPKELEELQSKHDVIKHIDIDS